MKSDLTCNIRLLSFFFLKLFHTWVQFSLERETMMTWWEVGRKCSLMQHFLFVSSSCLKIRHKNGCIRESTEEEVMQYDWVPTPDFPSLDSPWMELFISLQTYWILLMNQTQNDKHILSNNVVGQTSYKFVYTYRLFHVNCHSFRLRMSLLQTWDISSFLRSLIHTHFCFDFHACEDK